MECYPSGYWEKSNDRCIWSVLSIPGCGELFSKLITGCHVRLNIKPTSQLRFSVYSLVSIAYFTIRFMYVVVLLSQCVFSNCISYPVLTRCSSDPFWCYQTISNTLKMGTELGPETSKNLHMLKRLSARENFV